MDKQEVVKLLNQDLAGELGAINQYIVYAAKTTGPYRPCSRNFFYRRGARRTGSRSVLADKIVALGGEPTTQAREVPAAKDNKSMVQAVLDAEKRAVADYTKTCQAG